MTAEENPGGGEHGAAIRRDVSGEPPVWHAMTVDEAFAPEGRAGDRALAGGGAGTQTYGRTSSPRRPRPTWKAFLRQYGDPMQIVLLIAGGISLFLPDQFATGVLLIGLTLLNAFLGMNQEGKAEASVAALQKMMVVQAKVRRGGEVVQVPMEQLVPGDIVNVEAGDLVPADGRILRAATLEIDESALTGESAGAEGVDAVAADAALGDRVDMAFMNTQVTRGAATFVVTATGMSTEVGHISDMLQSQTAEATPLTKQLNKLTNQILVIAGVALAISIGSAWPGTSRSTSSSCRRSRSPCRPSRPVCRPSSPRSSPPGPPRSRPPERS